jgi:hypothetical protein
MPSARDIGRQCLLRGDNAAIPVKPANYPYIGSLIRNSAAKALYTARPAPISFYLKFEFKRELKS